MQPTSRLRHLFAATSLVPLATAVAATAGEAPHPSCIRPFGLRETRWTEGHWARQQELCFTRTIPSLRRVIDKPGSKAAFTNFKLVAGQAQDAKGDCRWGDGDVYKYLEALCYALAATGDATLDRELDARIAVITRAQQANGYLHTVNQLAPSSLPLAIRFNHEDYNFGHLFTAAAAHHAVTGKTSLLTVARRAADLLFSEFYDQPARAANFGWNPSHLMGLIDLYQPTGDRRYLELCRVFVDARGTQPTPRFPTAIEPHPGDQNQLRRPLRKETEAVGHAVTATYLYCGAADVARETGDRELLRTLVRIGDDIFASKLYITGGVAAYHRGHSPRGDDVHEAFANAYDLPLATRMIEANPLVESTVNQAAVMRGPLVFCLESPDLPKGVTLHEVRRPRDAAFEPVFLPPPLDRARGLRCEVVVRPGLAASRAAPLYGPLRAAPARREKVTLIPYFAWNNRGEPHMRVWLPLAN